MTVLVEVYTTVDNFPSLTAVVQLNNFESVDEFKQVVGYDQIIVDELRLQNPWGEVNVWEGEGEKSQLHRVRLMEEQDWLPVLMMDVHRLYRHEVERAEERRMLFAHEHPAEV